MIERVLGYDVELDIEDDDVVTGLVVIAQVQKVRDDGDALVIGAPQGTTQVTMGGLLFNAYHTVANECRP